eukprot:CAMPEP_0115164236 /NCGR_PEP_ID=MMETSP0227-20121206/72933_1 /TAXON_ID=89957 /ORGANISM="Polarella glacialis, Strain CCMP 1383" /LENGTH=88 /DNA_ID=CAMNT_0002576591 /DNA_START=375 /DNA_END=637 /DNA_ORIENTATION=+
MRLLAPGDLRQQQQQLQRDTEAEQNPHAGLGLGCSEVPRYSAATWFSRRSRSPARKSSKASGTSAKPASRAWQRRSSAGQGPAAFSSG